MSNRSYCSMITALLRSVGGWKKAVACQVVEGMGVAACLLRYRGFDFDPGSLRPDRALPCLELS